MHPESIGIDHLYIAASDLAHSRQFYDCFMRILGFRKNTFTNEGERRIQWFRRSVRSTAFPRHLLRVRLDALGHRFRQGLAVLPRDSPDEAGELARDGNGDRLVMDIQPGAVDNFHMFAFLSWFESMTQQCGSAHRLRLVRNPRSRKADTLGSPVARHGD